MRKLLVVLLAVAGLAVGWLAWVATSDVRLASTPYEFTVRSGSGLKAVGRQLAADRVLIEGESLWILGRLAGKGQRIQAGTYRLDKPLNAMELIDKLARGDVVFVDAVFVEGITLKQWLAQLAAHPRVKQTLAGKSEAELRALLAEDQPLEGLFFPDTYRFAPGTSDLEILKRAHAIMKKRLADAWAGRDASVPLKSPYEALILASIVEKETGAAAERPLIASVFANRIRRGMRLQTDPTVIYGMGERYDGNIRKRDLTTDTPWNTYTRDGLPPTPIAMPGAASIRAATNPATSEYLYFVARGDGSHEFTRSLEEHNRAVAKYQLGVRPHSSAK
ncbi:MAG TPA: endolytic transglycosylase MltG [Usitatibacter sp.]|nr:endolytic transglycosylase MltG [Usitatibacter sp.]